MKITTLLFLSFLLMRANLVIGQTKKLVPLDDFFKRTNQDITDTSNNSKIYKITKDLNGDGLEDIGLSCSETWGNAGGEWHFYIKTNDNRYLYYDKIDVMYSFVIINQKTKPNLLIMYGRNNCCSGVISYFEISKNGFKLSKTKKIGFNQELDGDEVSAIVDKELSKGQAGVETTAYLKCLLKNKKDCWRKN